MSIYLSFEQVHKLTSAAISGGLTDPGARDQLLAGIHPGFVAGLPILATPLDQLLSDLQRMNDVPYLVGNEVPLQKWLLNATLRLQRYARPEQALFREILREVEVKSLELIEGTIDIPVGAKAIEEIEQVIHEDDTLAYGWLTGAVAVGTSVARLSVTRYENGAPKYRPYSAQPLEYRGTGWLIGNQYLITNHHVINARSEGEPNAAESDLVKQAVTARVEFDYDADGMATTPGEVDSLCAWAVWNARPALDYAILKLKQPSPRRPLTLAPDAVQQVAESILPVNIVQHPNGNPKRLGIRNNLVNSMDEWELRYFTDTEAGSSGAPVCNDYWQVIALHRATKHLNKKVNFQGKETAYVNRGVRIDRIVEDLQQNHAALWAAMGVTLV